MAALYTYFIVLSFGMFCFMFAVLYFGLKKSKILGRKLNSLKTMKKETENSPYYGEAT